MADFITLKNAAIVGETTKARQVQADVRVRCAGGDRQLSLTFWVPEWAARGTATGVEVDGGVLAQKEEEDVKRAAERRGCRDVTAVEVLTR